MQTARRLSKIGRVGYINRNILYLQQPRRYITDYQTKVQGWETSCYQALAVVWVGTFVGIATTQASNGIIDKLLPFSFGKPRQGPYFPPHCRYITPYDDIVKAHKQKQKQKMED